MQQLLTNARTPVTTRTAPRCSSEMTSYKPWTMNTADTIRIPMYASREAVWQANAELGRTTVVLAAGAYVIPIAAIAALFTAIVLVVRCPRAGAEPVAWSL